MSPPPENPQALKLGPLQVEILLGVLAAGAAYGDRRHFQLLAAQFFVDLDLDGQAMAIPTGNVGGIEPRHGLRLHHKILQAFVERMAEVELPIGVGGAVVQHVAGSILPNGADLLIDPVLLPGGQPPRLALGQICLHREISMG